MIIPEKVLTPICDILLLLTLIARSVCSGFEVFFPSETATPTVTGSSSVLSKDGYPLRINISVSRYNLILTLNEVLLPASFSSIFLNADEYKTKLKNCFYQGWVAPFQYKNTSHAHWNATISMCMGLQGDFGSTKDGYIGIKPKNRKLRTIHQQHLLHHVTETKLVTYNMTKPLQLPFPKDPFEIRKKIVVGVNPYMELKVYIDKLMYENHEKDPDELDYYVASLINTVDMLYSPHNIDVILTDINVWQHKNIIEGYPNVHKVLRGFNVFLYKQGTHKFDVAVLLSGMEDIKILGSAYLDSVCSRRNGLYVGLKQPSLTLHATIVAHEIGHTLGLKHYNTIADCHCEDISGKCIMAKKASTRNLPTTWSTCSTLKIESRLQDYSTSCLYVKNGGAKSIFRNGNTLKIYLGIFLPFCHTETFSFA